MNKNEVHYTIYDLLLRAVGKIRHKAIGTLMKRKKMGYEQARKYQAEQILKK